MRWMRWYLHSNLTCLPEDTYMESCVVKVCPGKPPFSHTLEKPETHTMPGGWQNELLTILAESWVLLAAGM